MEDRIWIEAGFDGKPAADSVAVEAMVAVIAGQDRDGARLTSEGRGAVVTILSAARHGDETCGHMSGLFSATLIWIPGAEMPVTETCKASVGDVQGQCRRLQHAGSIRDQVS